MNILKKQLISMKTNYKRYVAFAFLFLAASIFAYVWFFGVNVFYLDEWSFASLVRKFQTEGLSFSLLFEQHNEHRILFPKLIYLAIFPLSQMNSKMIMFLNALLVCIEFICFYLIAKKQFKFSITNIPIWIIILPLFVFNFRQWQNLIWAFQVVYYLALIFAVLSLFFIEKAYTSVTNVRKPLFLLLAITFAIMATYSGAMGFLVWIAGGVQIFIRNTYARNTGHWVWAIIWIVLGIIAFYIYNHGLNSSISQSLEYGIKHPFEFIRFFFSLISLTSVHSLSIVAFPIGIIVFSISIFVIYKTFKNKRLTENSFWIAIYIFSILFSILTTIGRCPVSFEYADRSRYTIFTALLIVSTFMMFYDNYRFSAKNLEKTLFKYFFWGLFILAIELNMIGLAFGVKQKKDRERIREIVLNYKTRSFDELKTIDPWLDDKFIAKMKDLAPYIEKNHYNVFREEK